MFGFQRWFKCSLKWGYYGGDKEGLDLGQGEFNCIDLKGFVLSERDTWWGILKWLWISDVRYNGDDMEFWTWKNRPCFNNCDDLKS